jgi:hypothetical protein
MIKVGFTGTQRGMTVDQLQSVIDLLLKCGGKGDEFHHGGCVGADVEAAKCARMFEYRTIRHPGDNPAKQDARFLDYDYRVVLPNLVRNHVIVDEVDVMIAAPGEASEVLRSGTWATIRYATKSGRKIHIVFPDGTVAP